MCFLNYVRRKYRLEFASIAVGNGFDAEVGFVPRKDYWLVSPEFEWFFYPESGNINQHSIGLDFAIVNSLGQRDTDVLEGFGMADNRTELSWRVNFKNTARFSVNLQRDYVLLFDDFDPTRVQEDDVFLAAGTDYTYTSLELNYNSDLRKKLLYRFSPTVGQFYNGFRAGIRGSFTYRYQPYGFVSLDYTYNHIALDAPFEKANLWLIGPRIDLTFTKKLFLTTFIQYNNQSDNLNINARFQWRFKPVSDFFLVYTDNYITDPFSQFGVRNRSIVAKLTYWLNL